jgi:hypothetical protein
MKTHRIDKTSLSCDASGRRLIALALLMLSTCSVAAPWEFDTALDLGAIYSDNIRLAPEGEEESETVFQIAPTFRLSREDDRLIADIIYQPQALFFKESDDANNVFHVVDASMTGTVVREALYVYASAARFQTIIAPDGPIPTSRIPITRNRTDSTILQLRPYWEQNLGSADVFAEAVYIDTSFDEQDDFPGSLIRNNVQKGARFNLNNHGLGEGFAWGLDYWIRRVEYEGAIPWEYQRATADIGYWIGGVRLFAAYGYETPYDSFFDSSLEDEFWEVGFQYAPNQRLDMEFATGERSFGKNYRGRFSYQLRRGTTTLSYIEQPATRGMTGFDRRPLTAKDALDNFLDSPTSADRFVRRRADWNTQIELSKSEFSLRFFWDSRESRTTDTGEELADEEFAGAAARWNWDLSQLSAVGLGASYVAREIGDRENEVRTFFVDYTLRMSSLFSLIFLAQHSVQESEGSGFAGYTENQVRITLRTEF